MNLLIPMAGAGQRFADAGYIGHKPVLPTIYHKTGKQLPMVVCAAKDAEELLGEKPQIIFVDRDFHVKDGVEDEICKYYPDAQFITIDKLTQGQACTCLLAEEKINNKTPLLIIPSDNGMIYNMDKFNKEKEEADILVFTFRENEAVNENPAAYGWMKTGSEDIIEAVSIKKPISDNPINDHAVVGTFWFKNGTIFVDAAKEMIKQNDKVNGEFYVDQAIKHALDMGYTAKVFEVERYICWGTPKQYEEYQKTYLYWSGFKNNPLYLRV